MSEPTREARQKFLETVRTLEKARGSRIWCIVHEGRGHICAPTLYSLYANRAKIGTGSKIELLLHSTGGHPNIGYSAMKFFRRRFKEVNVLVPLMAKSAATLMCLGADAIFMGELADLGPIDIQIDDQVEHGAKNFSPLDEFKSIEFMREQAIEWMEYYAVVMNHRYGMSLKEALKDSIPLVTGLMRPMFEQIDPLDMGGHRRALAIGEEYATRMLAMTGNPNAKDIVRQVAWEYPSHDFCIDFEEAERLGLPVKRLPEDQEVLLTGAIMNLEEDDTYHGFAPTEKKTEPDNTVRKKKRSANPRGKEQRANGRDITRPEERI